MKHILLPEHKERRLVFYLSMEEFVARQIDEEDCFFLWQVKPTVICGRNQLIDSEVNISYCRQEGVQVYRRKSGGGCVYADEGNLMLSYITGGGHAALIFDRYLRRIAWILRKIGIEADVSGRNDILIGGKKVSGNAFYQLPGRSIVHGTLLFNTDFGKMEQTITPSDDKLKSKGVASVRQHVTNLSEYTDMSVECFKQYIIEELCDGEQCLTESEVAAIEEIERTYLDEHFLYGHNPRCTFCRHKKVEGVGEMSVELGLKSDIIKGIALSGDFFLLKDLQAELERRLTGKAFRKDTVTCALEGLDMGSYILHLTLDKWIDLLFE